jgi:uncharacterized membrane protein
MYRTVVLLHIACGVVALATYWIAALSRKGSPLHRGAGKAYLAGMVGIVLTSIVLAASFLLDGKTGTGTFLAYLVVITATAMWQGWTAIRRKRDQAAYRDRAYLGVAVLNLASGAVVFVLGLRSGNALLMGFCWIGIVLGAQMLWRAWKPLDEAKWWLREHIGAMLGCGIATHVAFLSIGLNRIVDLLGLEMDLGLLPWFGPVVVAMAAGAWMKRKYLKAPAARPLAVGA